MSSATIGVVDTEGSRSAIRKDVLVVERPLGRAGD